MKIFLVVGAADSWHATGYGHALLAGDAKRVLVSFVEYVKTPEQSMRIPSPVGPYVIPRKSKDTQMKPGFSVAAWDRIDHGTAFRVMLEEHEAEIYADNQGA